MDLRFFDTTSASKGHVEVCPFMGVWCPVRNDGKLTVVLALGTRLCPRALFSAILGWFFRGCLCEPKIWLLNPTAPPDPVWPLPWNPSLKLTHAAQLQSPKGAFRHPTGRATLAGPENWHSIGPCICVRPSLIVSFSAAASYVDLSPPLNMRLELY